MATSAKCSEIFQPAHPAAFGDGVNVIGLPQIPAATRTPGPGRASKAIPRASRADAPISLKHLAPHKIRIRADAVLCDASLRAKRAPRFRDRAFAPATGI